MRKSDLRSPRQSASPESKQRFLLFSFCAFFRSCNRWNGSLLQNANSDDLWVVDSAQHETAKRNGFFRIVIADDDDVSSFQSQRELNKLIWPCTVQRITTPEKLLLNLRETPADLVIVGPEFSKAELIKKVKVLAPNLPLICLVKKEQGTAPDLLASGASNCLFTEQSERLAEAAQNCIIGRWTSPDYLAYSSGEGHLDWPTNLRQIPVWALSWLGKAQPRFSKLEQKLRSWCTPSRQMSSTHEEPPSEVSRRNSPAPRQAGNSSSAPRNRANLGETCTVSSKTPSGRVSPGAGPNGSSQVASTRQPKPSAPGPDTRRWDGPTEPVFDSLSAEMSFKILFQSSLDAVFLVDAHLQILHVNGAGCALLGLNSSDLLGTNLLWFVSGPQEEVKEQLRAALGNEGSFRGKMHLLAFSGAVAEVDLYARSDLWPGVHLLIAKDETELNRLRSRVGQASKAN